MKKHHYILILSLVFVAGSMLYQTLDLKQREDVVSTELDLLREAAGKSPGPAAKSTPAGESVRPPEIDAGKFTTVLSDLLKANQGSDRRAELEKFFGGYESQLRSAPLAKLKEIFDLMEKMLHGDHMGDENASHALLVLLRLAAKSDPAWAFSKIDQLGTKTPTEVKLAIFTHAFLDGEKTMSPAYASALGQWLDAAKAAGRIDEDNPQIRGIRAGIAAALGDQAAVVKEISQMPRQTQLRAANDYVKGLQTHMEQRQALEQLSGFMNPNSFPEVAETLAQQQGFDAARDILNRASLTPLNHDLAAAAIAAAKIGPETKDRAAWLVENLRTDDRRALERFAKLWTQGNFEDSANWIGGMPRGPRRDAALKGFIPTAARLDGAAAMDWALTVSDPLLRNMLYCEAHENWRQFDAKQADAYHDAHPLDMEALKAASK